MAQPPEQPPLAPVAELEGVLEIGENKAAFLRDLKRHLVARANDPVVPPEAIRKLGLRGGEWLGGVRRPGRGGPQAAPQLHISHVHSIPVAKWSAPSALGDTTAIDPHERIQFATKGGPKSMWVVDLFTPIGRGQRGLIVAPPRTGKTVLLQQMAHGLARNHPEIYMIVLLVDERPEEVTEFRRNVHGEVIASSNDLDVLSHVRVARLVIERAKRLVEIGQHVMVLLDSITRLGRAFNSFVGSSGRTMTGGLDIRALQEPKQMFGAARNVEHGGSLTIIATALVQTGSRADEFIFQEFKGTGNMELVLDREVANQRVWPAMDLRQSGTRKEEKLLDEATLAKVHKLRRVLDDLPPVKQITTLLERMERFDGIEAFLANLQA